MDRKIYIGLALTLVLAVLVPFYWVLEPYRMTRASETMRQEAIATGAELFALHCASCHGEGGKGGTGPPLKTIEFLTQHSDEDIFKIIARGRGSMMPASSQEEGGPLTSQQIEALVALLRSWEAAALPLPTPTPLVDDGVTLWARFCAGCHGPSGRGTPDVELKLNSRRFLLLNDDEAIRQVVVEGRPERGMPVYGDLLSAAEIDTLVSFIREWEAGAPRRELGGATLFARYCAFCHGPTGEGGRDPNNPSRVVPPLNSVEYLSAKDDQFLRQVTLEGEPEVGMPPWRDVLTDAELSRLIAFMRGWQIAPAELSGEELFARYCIVCHGSEGEGGPNPFSPEQIIVSLNSLEYLESHDDSSLREVIAQGLPEEGMAPFAAEEGGPLNSQEIELLVDFIRGWEREVSTPSAGETAGKSVYAQSCAACHGEGGEGLVGSALVNNAFMQGLSDEALRQFLLEGNPEVGMPGFAGRLTEEEITYLIALLRAWQK